MPAKYSVVAKVNPQDPQGPRKFYPSYKSNGRADTRKLAVEAADRSTLSDADMDAALANLLTLIPKHLAMGEITGQYAFCARQGVQGDAGYGAI